MKSLLLTAYNHLEITDMPVPTPKRGEVLVRVEACGICGSDVHGLDGSTGRRIPPIVMGHEAAGTVEAVGEGVTRFAKGDRVTFDSTVYCGECPYCKIGQINLCDNREVIGVSEGNYRRHGAFAEYVVIPDRIMYPLPADFKFEEAAMLEAVSVAMHGVKVSPVAGGETALVIGAGMIGLLTLQAAKAAGCSRVFIADVDETRLNLAHQIGADEVLHCSGAELLTEIKRLTNGCGVDLVLEAVGLNQTVNSAIDCVRKAGTVTLIGNVSPEVTLPLQKVVVKQIKLQGSCASSGEYPEAIELISAGKIKVKPLITAVAGLEEGPRWFDRLHSREPNLMKIILSPRI
jgi:Threonine dehydrogenase and related Zn-dependent dehydrogenases